MKHSIWTKKEMLVSLRAVVNAIASTDVGERIDLHLKEIESIARVVRHRHLTDSPLWLAN